VVGPGLEAIEQSRQVLLQVLCLTLCGLAVDANRSLLAGAPMGFLQEWHVKVMREGGQHAPG
jgi:hypothetical protein